MRKTSPEEWDLRRTILLSKLTNAERLAWHFFIKLKIPVYIQEPLPPYIVDFIGMDRNFILEVDGWVHDNTAEYDDGRSKRLYTNGFNIFRLDNKQINEENLKAFRDMPKVGLDYMKELIAKYRRSTVLYDYNTLSGFTNLKEVNQ